MIIGTGLKILEILNQNFLKKSSLGGNVSSKLSNKIKYSNISYVTKDNVLKE
jgi:hypothetical protein